MRIVYLLITIYIGLFLSGCTEMDVSQHSGEPPALPKQSSPPAKNPIAVNVYTERQALPNLSYKILGKATISKYNPGGIKRQEASIHDAMRNLAASMGGDAVIEINHNDKTVSGTVIAYENKKKQKLS